MPDQRTELRFGTQVTAAVKPWHFRPGVLSIPVSRTLMLLCTGTAYLCCLISVHANAHGMSTSVTKFLMLSPAEESGPATAAQNVTHWGKREHKTTDLSCLLVE